MLASDPDYHHRAISRIGRRASASFATWSRAMLPFNITWQGLEEFEDYADGRALLKELGLDLKKLDPYQHPRSSNAKITSSPLLADGWMDFVIEGIARTTRSARWSISFIQCRSSASPTRSICGTPPWTASIRSFAAMARSVAKYWFDFMADTRHWELEPYFDVDGTRAVALEDVEYVNYIEHPGPPVEVTVEKHGYDVQWLNPATGESLEQKKYSGEHFTGEAPGYEPSLGAAISRARAARNRC